MMKRLKIIEILKSKGWVPLSENALQELWHYPKDNDILPIPKRPMLKEEQAAYLLKIINSK